MIVIAMTTEKSSLSRYIMSVCTTLVRYVHTYTCVCKSPYFYALCVWCVLICMEDVFAISLDIFTIFFAVLPDTMNYMMHVALLVLCQVFPLKFCSTCFTRDYSVFTFSHMRTIFQHLSASSVGAIDPSFGFRIQYR